MARKKKRSKEASKIRETLEALELSQVGAAKILGIDPRTMRRYVSNSSVPRPVMLLLESWVANGLPK